MKIRVSKIKRYNDGDSILKAIATIILDEKYYASGLRLIKGTKTLYVAMPQVEGMRGEYRNAFYPATKEARADIENAVINAYLYGLK